MKYSRLIIFALTGGALASMVAANVVLKREYDGLNKNNPFWNYTTLETGSFSHVKVVDSRSTWIVFRPSSYSSAGVMTTMADQHRVETQIRQDTLFISIVQKKDDSPGLKAWLARNQLVCVSAPHLRSIVGESAAMEIKDYTEEDLSVLLSGDSRVSVETRKPAIDSVFVALHDSSELKIQVAKDLPSGKGISVAKLEAALFNKSRFDASQLQIVSIDQKINDAAAIALNGVTLAKFRK